MSASSSRTRGRIGLPVLWAHGGGAGVLGVCVLRYDWQGNICTHKSGKPFFLPVNLKTMGKSSSASG